MCIIYFADSHAQIQLMFSVYLKNDNAIFETNECSLSLIADNEVMGLDLT